VGLIGFRTNSRQPVGLPAHNADELTVCGNSLLVTLAGSVTQYKAIALMPARLSRRLYGKPESTGNICRQLAYPGHCMGGGWQVLKQRFLRAIKQKSRRPACFFH